MLSYEQYYLIKIRRDKKNNYLKSELCSNGPVKRIKAILNLSSFL